MEKKGRKRKEGKKENGGRVLEYKDQSCHQRTWDNLKLYSSLYGTQHHLQNSLAKKKKKKSKINKIEPESHQAFRSNHQFIRVKKEGKGDKLNNTTMD